MAVTQSLPSTVTTHLAGASSPTIARSPQSLATWHPIRLVGEGSWCRVYQARPSLSPPTAPADYAVKVLKPEHERDGLALAMLGQEVRVARFLNHPFVLPILGSHLVRTPYYLVMPYIRGLTLRTLLDQSAPLAVPRSLWFARQACEALRVVHAAGWIHGDIKPSNFLIQRGGHLELFDFGLARQYGDGIPPDAPPTNIAGTPAYAAPELLMDNQTATPATDLYSLGVTLFEMLSGRVPFPHTTAPKLAAAHLRESPPDLRSLVPSLPIRLNWLMKELLAKLPSHRPDTETLLTRLVEIEIETLGDYG